MSARARRCSLTLIAVLSGSAQAQSPAPQSAAQQQLNPLADAAKLTATLSDVHGPDGDSQPNLNFEPLIPFGLTEQWRMVTRPNVTLVRVPAAQGGKTGLNDTQVSAFLTPAKTREWVWGAGPIVQIPTATAAALGTGKWSLGPTGALVYVAGPWVNGFVASHLWSVAGPGNRARVSVSQLEAQVSYSFANNYYIDTAPTFSYDWSAAAGQRWTVPVGFDAGKVLTSGAHSLSLQFGYYYNVQAPAGTSDWTLDVEASLQF